MLFIAEKPDVARAIANAIGTKFISKDGYMSDGKNTVTWCFGHMLRLQDPAEYDLKYKFWSFDTLPFLFIPYKRTPIEKNIKQLKIIKSLIKDAKIIVNAGDPDDEGQLLVDEILREVNNKKPVKRLLINDNNIKVVKRSLSNMQDNSLFEYMGYQAEARAVADQTLGYNLTQSYSLLHQMKTSTKGVISVGRVQSAILGLIVRRDEQNSNHKASNYFNIFGEFNINNISLKAKFTPNENYEIDDKNRLINEAQALEIANFCKNKPSTIISADTLNKSTTAPLPYNLIKLQQDCSKKFGFNPTKTLKITQDLREKHHLITYNRSDCQYLSEEQHSDAAEVLNHVYQNLYKINPSLASTIKAEPCNFKIKNRAFDSSKVSAHHAIIPSETVVDFDKLTTDEIKVYELIAKSYIALFYPEYLYIQTKVIISVDKYNFSITSNIPKQQGWKVLFNDLEDDESDIETTEIDLRSLNLNDVGVCIDTIVNKELTKPLPLYTMSSLLSDLTRVAKYIKDPNLANILKERDKDKEGENGGIGTPATRDSIINTLFDRGFIIESKKKIISTDLGKSLYSQLSDRIKYPDLSALWAEKFEKIKTHNDVINFIQCVMDEHISPDVNQLKCEYGELKEQVKQSDIPCPECGRDMELKNGQYGKYWGCTGYFDKENQCKNIMNDENGVPVKKEKKIKDVKKSDIPCPECGRDMELKNGQYGKYWGCTGYFDKKNQCKNIMKDENGIPVIKTIITMPNDNELILLSVPYEDKDKVKKLGAKWSVEKKSWYILSSQDQNSFKKWLSKI